MGQDINLPRVTPNDLPGMFLAADASALDASSLFLRLTRVRLAALAAAAPVGVLTIDRGGADWAGVLLLLLFVTALLAELLMLRLQPERTWYDGRAAAESVKTLAWRYIVAGHPFGKALPETSAVELFAARLDEIRQQFPGIHWIPVRTATQLTATMEAIRRLSLNERKAVYLRDRIEDQELWYTDRGARSRTSATRWSAALVSVEAGGVIGGLLKAMGIVRLDFVGIAGALATAAIAWSATKQFSSQAEAYGVAGQELGIIATKVPRDGSEDDWAAFVDEAEEAISREHTTWLASRS